MDQTVYCYVCGWVSCATDDSIPKLRGLMWCPVCWNTCHDSVPMIRVSANVSPLLWKPIDPVRVGKVSRQ